MPPDVVQQVTRGLMRRATRGLFAGRRVLSGNKVSEDGGNRWVAGEALPLWSHLVWQLHLRRVVQ